MTASLARLVVVSTLIVTLFACSDGGIDDAGPGVDDTPSDDAGQGSGTCGLMRDGDWQADGTCTGGVVSMTVTTSGCNVTFANWSGSTPGPASAVIDDRTVRYSGNGYAGCTGDLAGSGRSVTGSCPSNATVGSCTLDLTQP
jgi:hypothetical protein